MTQSMTSYLRSTGIGAAVPNMVPAIAWLLNRQMEFVPLTGDNSLIMDTAITSVVLTLIVTLFIASGTPASVS